MTRFRGIALPVDGVLLPTFPLTRMIVPPVRYQPFRHLIGHQETVYSVLFLDRSGQVLASGSDDHTVRIWRVAEGQTLRTLSRYNGSVTCLDQSPIHGWLATGSHDHRIKCWRLFTGLFSGRWPIARQRLAYEAHRGAVYGLAFTPDDQWLISGGTDNAVQLTRLSRPDLPPISLRAHSGHIYQVAVSPNGRWLASASMDNTIALWDLPRLTARSARQANAADLPLVTLHGHRDGVTSIAFSPDGSLLASGSYDRTIKLWDLSLLPHDLTTLRYAVPITLRGHTDCVQSIAFSANGRRLASASSDYTVRLWQIDGSRSRLIDILRGHTDKVHAVALSADGRRIASAGKDRSIIVWQPGPAG